MKRAVVFVAVVLLGVWMLAPTADSAQDTKWVRGTVTAVSDSSITVKVRDRDFTFSVDQKTELVARGAGTKARQAAKAGEPGIKLTDIVKVGEGVEVRYHDMAGSMHAGTIRAGISAGAGSTSEDTPRPRSVSGTVTSVSASSLTIKARDKEMTFTVDKSTEVVGRGVGTLSREKREAGGGLIITDAVGKGDSVEVSYSDAGGEMRAAKVRITRKATTN